MIFSDEFKKEVQEILGKDTAIQILLDNNDHHIGYILYGMLNTLENIKVPEDINEKKELFEKIKKVKKAIVHFVRIIIRSYQPSTTKLDYSDDFINKTVDLLAKEDSNMEILIRIRNPYVGFILEPILASYEETDFSQFTNEQQLQQYHKKTQAIRSLVFEYITLIMKQKEKQEQNNNEFRK